jgi:hypothetical protein
LFAAPAALAQGGEEAEEKAAEESPYAQATNNAKRKAPAKSYTNADLERMFGPSGDTEKPPEEATPAEEEGGEEPADSAEKPAEEAPDPLKKLFEDEKKREEHEVKIGEATEKIAAAERRVADLERRALAISNPLLARPTAPEDGAEEWDAADSVERLEQNEAAIEAAREELEQARAELEQLQESVP